MQLGLVWWEKAKERVMKLKYLQTLGIKKKNQVSIIGNIDYLKYQNRVLNLLVILVTLVLVINHKAELLICLGHQITPGWVSVLWYLHYHVEEQQTQIWSPKTTFCCSLLTVFLIFRPKTHINMVWLKKKKSVCVYIIGSTFISRNNVLSYQLRSLPEQVNAQAKIGHVRDASGSSPLDQIWETCSRGPHCTKGQGAGGFRALNVYNNCKGPDPVLVGSNNIEIVGNYPEAWGSLLTALWCLLGCFLSSEWEQMLDGVEHTSYHHVKLGAFSESV